MVCCWCMKVGAVWLSCWHVAYGIWDSWALLVYVLGTYGRCRAISQCCQGVALACTSEQAVPMSGRKHTIHWDRCCMMRTGVQQTLDNQHARWLVAVHREAPDVRTPADIPGACGNTEIRTKSAWKHDRWDGMCRPCASGRRCPTYDSSLTHDRFWGIILRRRWQKLENYLTPGDAWLVCFPNSGNCLCTDLGCLYITFLRLAHFMVSECKLSCPLYLK